MTVRRFKSYLADASHFRGWAQKIFFPTNESQIARRIREANRTGVPLTVSGAGTGLTGGRVPQGGNILATDRLSRIRKIHWSPSAQKGYAVVEPGVRLQDLQMALRGKMLFYPPNPGEGRTFIGGNVATNASGSRSFKYGSTRRWVKRLRIVLPSGDLLEVKRGRIKAKGRHFSIRLPGGRKISFQIPRLPRQISKNCAGYFAKPNMDLIDLFIGSEGTLGVFTQIELQILRQPQGLLSGFLFFKSEKESFHFAQEAKKLRPRALEFFDSRSLRLLSKKHPNIPASARAALFFEEEIKPQQADGAQERWVRLLPLSKHPPSAWFSSKPQGEEYFRQIRHDLPVLVNTRVERNGFRKVGTDLAVPARAAKVMFDFYLSTLKRSRIPYVLFGHLGDHHLHANLLPGSSKEFERSQKTYEVLAKKAIALGGTISAEHGIGKLRIPYLRMMVGEKGMAELTRVKQALDPNGILNPGNIIPAQ